MTPRRKLTAPLVATLAAAGLMAAGLTAAGAGSVAAAAGPGGSGGVHLNAGYLRVGLDGTGAVTSLVDARNGRDYLVAGHGTAPLVSLVIDGQQVKPTALQRSGSLLAFKNPAAGTEVDVAVNDRATYATFTVTRVKAPRTADVQSLLWGPLATTLTGTLGESVGIAGNGGFSAGMKVLNDRTEGGWPREDTGMGWQSEVSNNPSNLQVAPLEQWSVGGRTPWGSLLRAFTFDYTKQRLRLNDSGYRIPVGPLPRGGGIVGSRIALFGTTPDLAPTVLSAIAQDQNLPYPTINGQWQKAAQATSKSIFVLSDLNTGNVGTADQFAKSAGIDMIYSLPGSDGPWRAAGHYQFNSSFGGSDAAATTLVNTSRSNGVAVGAHTLSNFIDTNDLYVRPSPSPDLARGQSATLTRPLASGDTSLSMANCAPLAGGLQGKRLLVDNEFLTYTGSSTVGGECQVTGLARAQWSSAAVSHSTAATVHRVQMNGYGGAYGDLNMIDAIATRFATIWNTTGITATSFDGLESASDSGWGQYGMARMVNGAFAQRHAQDGFISETSRMGSNIWDGLSRASWGEVGATSMNQVFLNNAYYQANHLPGMLGWIALPGNAGLRAVEDTLARGAGLNAGAGFETSVSSLTAGGQNTSLLLDAVKQWEAARNSGAFTDSQRAQFRDQSTHWHLSVITPGTSWSLQQRNASGNDIGAPRTVSVPTPGFPNTTLPGMKAGKLYEARPAANVPSIIRYEITGGRLPCGLRLNADTGGITGIPTTSATSRFTLTGIGAPGTPNARQTFTIGAATPPSPPTAGTLSLTSAFDNVGVTSQTDVATGNFDGSGNSFSAEQLAAAGVTAGATVTVQGTAFAWPDVAAGTPDNVAGSAMIPGSGHGGSTLAFLGSEAGDVTDDVTVTYTDGTTATASVGFPNWLDSSPTEFGATLAFSTQGRNTPGGYGNTSGSYRVFFNQIPLDPTKTIATVQLPATTKIHIFALTAR
ncbi:putative Ig domain-containing protein [Streptomyces sp. SID13588]|uniref:putative Ig domain-containing protein n=1 Tax=Streptomyces sp. SID13588 TaxID=2706051 RepID=UPI0013CAB70B|nr:putative Ig domain-containing protein [Streptomyces sp. SID13588]NEA72346.1 hypothetical protein [Streptomyces sp. SID13588]